MKRKETSPTALSRGGRKGARRSWWRGSSLSHASLMRAKKSGFVRRQDDGAIDNEKS